MHPKEVSAAQNEETEQRTWESPVVEELDFNATEAAYGVPGAVEFGIYTT
jgi:hypothetical protein